MVVPGVRGRPGMGEVLSKPQGWEDWAVSLYPEIWFYDFDKQVLKFQNIARTTFEWDCGNTFKNPQYKILITYAFASLLVKITLK